MNQLLPVPRAYFWAMALFCGLASSPAFAQEGEAPKEPEGEAPQKLPLKRAPAFNSKNLNIPSVLPGVKAVPTKEPRTKVTPPPVGQPPPPAIPNIGANPGGSKPDSDESFANVKAAGGKNCKPLKGTDKVTFDFKGDILELVETISKTTCKNFILTNKVRTQKFEILSPSPITVDEAWRAFLSALEANDFSIIQVGRYYKIIQAADGVRAPVPIYAQGTDAPVDDRMVTVIWKPQHSADVNAVVNYLNIFKSTKGQIHPFASTGTLIITDFGTSVERLRRIFDEIDQPGALEQVHVVTIQFAGAQEIADKLTQVFEPKNAAAAAAGGKSPSRIKMAPQSPGGEAPQGTPPPGEGPEDEGVVSVSKILADDRTNKLIIIATDRAFAQIMSLMRELDVPETSGSGQIHVLRLKHADAEELASTLASLAQGKPTTPKAVKPSSSGAKAPAPPIPSGGAATGASLFEGDVKVTSDKSTNSLVITASMADLTSMKRVIEKLDVPRYQVFVEAVIMEVSVKNDRQVGVGWHGGIPLELDGQQRPILFGNTPNRELSSLLTAANPIGLASLLGFAGAFSGPTLKGTEDLIPGSSLGIPGIGVVLQALQSTNDVNIISTPHLLTMDNEDAEIQVNEKRPFPSGLTLGGGGGLGALAGLAGAAGGAAGNLAGLGLGSVNFNREDIGLTLKLKPQINDEDYVKLEIDQELSDVAGTDQVTGQVITSKRAAKTTVVVRSQDSVVIGGLVRDRETISESKTPILGDLPLIGWLFKRQAKAAEKVNLLLVLTPYIIRGPADFRTIFERKMAERKEFADRFFGTSTEYQASIDWSRKSGPLASYRTSMRKELNRAENEGPGDDDELIIREGEKKLEPVQIGPAPTPTPMGEDVQPLDTPAVPIPETPPVEP